MSAAWPAGTAAGASGWLRELVRAAAGPLICAVVLTGLLAAWVAVGGAGTISRVRIEVTLAAVPMSGYPGAPASASAAKTAGTYVTIRNLAGAPDELISVRSPDASRVVLTARAGPDAAGRPVPGLGIPAHGTLTLSPFGADAVLVDPAPFRSGGSVPLILTFARAGQVTVDAAVTAPGTP